VRRATEIPRKEIVRRGGKGVGGGGIYTYQKTREKKGVARKRIPVKGKIGRKGRNHSGAYIKRKERYLKRGKER